MTKNLCSPFVGTITLAALISTGSASAMTPFLQQGANLTLGPISQTQTIFGSINNPAAAAWLSEGDTWAWKWGGLNLAGRVEYGPVDNMLDSVDTISALQKDVEKLADIYKEVEDGKSVSEISYCTGKTEVTCTTELLQELDHFAEQLLDTVNSELPTIAESGYFDMGMGVYPLMPMVVAADWNGGAITVDAHAYLQGRLTILDDEFVINPLSTEPMTNTALYVKGVVGAEFGLGYSHSLYRYKSGVLFGGARAKMVQMELSKTLVGIVNSDDAGQTLEDTFDSKGEAEIELGLDAGLLWIERNYRLGMTINNLIEPEFRYKEMGTGCSEMETNSQEQNTCFLAQSFADRIDINETHLMNTQVNLEAAIYTESQNWMAAISYDTNSILDPLGNEYQFLVFSAGYVPDSWWRPGFRMGHRSNQVGSELSEITLGISWLRMSLDLAMGLEEITVNEVAIPRTMAGSFGIDFSF